MILWINAVIFGLSGCVVSDEIEFYDKVNMPPLLDSLDPRVDVINAAVDNSTREFTIAVWDPDKDDATLYAGRIKVIDPQNSSPLPPSSCDVEYLPNPDRYEGGVLVTLKCSAVFQLNVSDVTNILVQVVVSDRGFLTQDELQSPDGANQLTLIWTWELYPEDMNFIDDGAGK